MENSIETPINLNSKQVSKPSTSQECAPIHDEVIETDLSETQQILQYLSSLPTGYRFIPTDVQLIRDYLRPKIANKPLPPCLIHTVNLYRFHPKTLAETYQKHTDREEVYYFTPRFRMYKTGSRPNRHVEGIGNWSATGPDVEIALGDELIGFKKSFVFYEGEGPTINKTHWIMNEYRSCESRKRTSDGDMKLDDWVLCKVHKMVSSNGNRQATDNNEPVCANNIEAPFDHQTVIVHGNPINNEELNLTATQFRRLVNYLIWFYSNDPVNGEKH